MLKQDCLYNGDCLEVLKEIPPKSISLLIADLPYSVLNKSNPNAQWDNIIPFNPMWECFKSVTRANSAIILFGQGMFTAQVMMSNPDMWRYNLIWDKKRATGFLNAKRMPLRYHEDIMVFYKKLPIYNPQMEDLNGREPNHPQGTGKHNAKNQCYGAVKRTYSGLSDKKYPRSIISIPADHSKERMHPTQKPTELMRYLIRTYSNPGDTVLDPVMGSGTTCVAAIKEKRHFIGIEKEKIYFDIAKERVDKELRNPTLF